MGNATATLTDQENIYRSYVDAIITLFLRREFEKVREETKNILAGSRKDDQVDFSFIEYISLNILGLVNLEEGNIESAETYLLDSASISSPAITSFGQNLLLAHKLWCVGRTASVDKYLRQIEYNSTSFFPSFTPSTWRQTLQNGGEPDFGDHRFMHFTVSKEVLTLLRDYAVCAE